MIKILHLLPILFLAVLILFLATSIFLGIGYVFSLFLPLSVFQSSLLCLGATFVVAFIILGVIVYDSLFGNHFDEFDEEYDDEDDEHEDDEDDVEMVERIMGNALKKKLSTDVNFGRIPRNAPCPCGSGKKYKLCCGKVSR